MIKPSMWAANRAQVVPEWQRFWDGLAFAFLYLDGRVVDLLSNERPNASTIGNSSRIVTPVGVGIDHGGRLEFDNILPLDPANGLTLLTWANPLANTRESLITQRVAASDHHIELRFSSTYGGEQSNGQFALILSTGYATAEDSSQSGTSDVDGKYHVFMGRYKESGSGSEVFSDGVNVTDSSLSTGASISPTGTFVLGGLPGTTTINYTRNKILDVGWNRALLDAEIQQLARDPFGPFRQARSLSLPLQYEQVVRR